MATADVLLPEAAASVLEQGNAFSYKVTIDTAAASTSTVTTKSSVPPTVDKDFFILNTQSFIDLQIFLKTALRLPDSSNDFETKFPSAMFAKYTDQDSGLYQVCIFSTKNAQLDLISDNM